MGVLASLASWPEILGQNEIFLTKQDEFSPDGRMLAQICPGLSTSENGVSAYPGTIIIWDLETGQEIMRTRHQNNENLYPPWGASEEIFVYVRNNNVFNRLEVYDRSSGERLSAHNFVETFGSGTSQLYHATKIPGSRNVAMTLGSHVVVFDPITAEIQSKTYVSDALLTEVVVTDKPLSCTGITEVRHQATSP